MLLAVDIGNTNISLGFIEDRRVVGSYRITTKANHTSDEYVLMLAQFLAMSGLSARDAEGIIVASVVPKVMHSFRASIVKLFHQEPMIVGPGIKTGLQIRLDDPKTLGADCLADCAGAYYHYETPALVIDFGTATTFNIVDAQGAIICGLITTGIQSGANALWGQTAQLPEVAIARPSSILASNTRNAMQAGLYYNFLGGVERTIEQFHSELSYDFGVIATGGLGRVFANDTRSIDVYDPDLIFKGMDVIYRKNQRR